MNSKLRDKLIKVAREKISNDDPSHDIQHALRVLKNAEKIANVENADLDIVVPGALFHDLITYPKNNPRSENSVDESAEETEKILKNIHDFPIGKIIAVKEIIKSVSFSKAKKPTTIEAKVVQDADMLEAVGAIAIMRTFSSSGIMNRPFYHPIDPFGKERKLDDIRYSIDLFFQDYWSSKKD